VLLVVVAAGLAEHVGEERLAAITPGELLLALLKVRVGLLLRNLVVRGDLRTYR